MTQMNISPEELLLLQEARRLGITSRLAEMIKQEKEERERKQAAEKAGTLAYRIYQAATGIVNGDQSVTVTITVTVEYESGKFVVGTYPPQTRSRTEKAKTGPTADTEIDRIIEAARRAGVLDQVEKAVKQEFDRRKLKLWQGLKVALRSAWAREIAYRFVPKPDPTQADPTQADPTQTDPTQADPTQADLTQTDPTQTDPTQTDPTQTDPTQTDPTAGHRRQKK